MKKVIYLLIVGLSLAFTSCGGDSDTPDSPQKEWTVATSSKGRIIYRNSKEKYYYYKDNDKKKERVYVDKWACGTHNGKQLWTGPRGGCYYINSKGNKTYVKRSECDCA